MSTNGVNETHLREAADHDPEFLKELVELFLRETPPRLDALAQAISKGEVVEARRIAHTCAGSCATCGVEGLTPLFRAIEHPAAEGKLDGAETTLAEIRAQYVAVEKEMLRIASA